MLALVQEFGVYVCLTMYTLCNRHKVGGSSDNYLNKGK